MEIKFKAKNLKTNQWEYGYYVEHLDTQPYPMVKNEEEGIDFIKNHTHYYILNDKNVDWGMSRQLLCHEIDKDTLCQFTGLIDSSGHNIYTHDILRIIKSDDSIVIVKAIYSCGEILFRELSSKKTYRLDIFDNIQSNEVIGNEYNKPTSIIKWLGGDMFES